MQVDEIDGNQRQSSPVEETGKSEFRSTHELGKVRRRLFV